MDSSSLPHFCRREGSGSSRYSGGGGSGSGRGGGGGNCFSLDHPFHQQLYSYIMEQSQMARPAELHSEGSFHVDVPEPDPEGSKIARTIECELHKFEDQNGLSKPMNGLVISGD